MKKLDEVLEMEAAVDRLNAKLRETCELLNKLPSESDWNDMSFEAGSIASSLEQVIETWNSDRRPSLDDLKEMSGAAREIADNLEESAD